jgi:molybdopterin/thiamine biosynthesis adenylyltransferase
MGVFAPLTGMVGAAQAGETLKLLTGRGEPMIGRMALIDARSMQWSEMIVPRLPTCSVCSSRGGWV